MAKKYDTNPLDPDFPEKVRKTQTGTVPEPENRTREFAAAADTEEQTRRFNQAHFTGYARPGETGQTPAAYRTAPLYQPPEPKSRKVDKVGLPENVLVALPYLPFTIGLIAGILELVFVPKSEAKVRFHAAQGLAAHIGILIVTTILGFAGNIIGPADWANGLFQLITTIMLIVFAVKAWKGHPVHIEWVDDLTNWLEDKINPRN